MHDAGVFLTAKKFPPRIQRGGFLPFFQTGELCKLSIWTHAKAGGRVGSRLLERQQNRVDAIFIFNTYIQSKDIVIDMEALN